jgi:hypothetical protein
MKVTDVTSQPLRCYELDTTVAGNTQTATVSAGSTVGFQADQAIYHPGVSHTITSDDERSKNRKSISPYI